MSFGNIIGQLLGQGLAGQSNTQARVGQSAQNIAQGGAGMEQILGSLQSMLGGGTPAGSGASGGGLGGLAAAAKNMLGSPQLGGMSGAQLGGLGALAGALLGGGGDAMKGAAGGGAMAILGTLALGALQNARTGGASLPGAGFAAGAPSQHEVASVTSEEGERLVLRAMIAAAKADGQVDPTEMDRILGQLKPDEVSESERRFVLDELHKPLDVAEIARDVSTPAQAAEVYAASLLAIDIDTDGEREYLRNLAAALRLDPGVVTFLHQTTGAPKV
jgi:uncharacterized membrane protein YebE (DUF533 family)